MTTRLTELQKRLFERPNFGHLATLMPDGSPHVSPVWVDLDGDQIVVNTATGRVKAANIRRDPRVGISIVDEGDPYTMVAVRGTATLDEAGADEHIDAMARKYTGAEHYAGRSPDERRVLIRIRPEHIAGMGAARDDEAA